MTATEELLTLGSGYSIPAIISDNSGGIYLKYFFLLESENPSVGFTPRSSKNTIPIDHTSLEALNPSLVYSGEKYFSVPTEFNAY